MSKILDPQGVEQSEQLAQALESLRVMMSRSVGITNEDYINYILDRMRDVGAVNCGDGNDWRACFEPVDWEEFSNIVSTHVFGAFSIIALRARGHIVVTPNPIPSIALVTATGFVLLARDAEKSECYAIINTPVVRRLLKTSPCEFALEF